jgi:endonuclease III
MENPPRLAPSNQDRPSNVPQVLDTLEELYGPQKLAGPADPYEMILFVNCGYPATDVSCAKGFDALKREVGLKPMEILGVPKPKLAKLMRLGGIVPDLRAKRLKEIARKVKDEFGGNLNAVLKRVLLQEEKTQAGKGIRAAKKVLQQFPVIGEPSAEKILLFSRLSPVAVVPSASLDVPIRLWFGEPAKNYAADYSRARAVLSAGLPENFATRQRAYLLLKKHGQEICKRSKPKCERCPLSPHCIYFQGKAADGNTERADDD